MDVFDSPTLRRRCLQQSDLSPTSNNQVDTEYHWCFLIFQLYFLILKLIKLYATYFNRVLSRLHFDIASEIKREQFNPVQTRFRNGMSALQGRSLTLMSWRIITADSHSLLHTGNIYPKTFPQMKLCSPTAILREEWQNCSILSCSLEPGFFFPPPF